MAPRRSSNSRGKGKGSKGKRRAPGPGNIRRRNLEKANQARRGRFTIPVDSCSAGSEIRGLREKGVETMMEILAEDGWSQDFVISVWEDIEHCKSVDLTPLGEKYFAQKERDNWYVIV